MLMPGYRSPAEVTRNRRSIYSTRLCQPAFDAGHKLTNGFDALGFRVGDVYLERFFTGHHDFDKVERVVQVVEEVRFRCDFLGRYFVLLSHQLSHLVEN